MEAKIILSLSIPENSIRRTRHTRSGVDVTNRIARVNVMANDHDSSVLSVYFDKDGHELNDLFHESIQDAISHLEWEYDIDVGDSMI